MVIGSQESGLRFELDSESRSRFGYRVGFGVRRETKERVGMGSRFKVGLESQVQESGPSSRLGQELRSGGSSRVAGIGRESSPGSSLGPGLGLGVEFHIKVMVGVGSTRLSTLRSRFESQLLTSESIPKFDLTTILNRCQSRILARSQVSNLDLKSGSRSRVEVVSRINIEVRLRSGQRLGFLLKAPPTADTPASTPYGSGALPPSSISATASDSPTCSGALPPSSIGATPSGSPTESPNVASLNCRVALTGSAFVAIFAASLIF
ncbi:hypothetical protein HAX54_051868 [Datura stramonium]|uniref:Uncharacterized protein n=1 Tax=Datura stramonium TaxID=4076 RepID=A0ABS8T0A9_DATST|nr:hypothetical protein [Datura stramonium]